jgi:hypothetical protein
LSLAVPNDVITAGLSNFDFDASPARIILFVGRATGNLYRLDVHRGGGDIMETTSVTVATKLAEPSENKGWPLFPPLG